MNTHKWNSQNTGMFLYNNTIIGTRSRGADADVSNWYAPQSGGAQRAYGYRNADYPRVMLARMAPGGVIKPHRDANPAAKWPHKVHVPLLTNPDVGFLVGDRVYHLPEGEAVEVNNLGIHAVRNDGASDRIHLIFEYFDLDQPAPDWVG